MRFKVDGKVYDYDESRLLLPEARMLQAATRLTVGQWQRGLNEGDCDAYAALVWLCERRAGRDIRLDEVDNINIASFEVLDEDDPADPEVPTAAADDAAETTSPATATA